MGLKRIEPLRLAEIGDLRHRINCGLENAGITVIDLLRTDHVHEFGRDVDICLF